MKEIRRAADAHREIDAFISEIDEAIREQQVRTHVRILWGETPARPPLEKHNAEPPFEPSDALAHCRTCEVQPHGCGREASCICSADKRNNSLQAFVRDGSQLMT
jgi:hypothetical protein